MFHNGTPIAPQLDAIPARKSSLNNLPESLRRWLLPAYPHAMRGLSNTLAHDHAQQPIDLLFSTSSIAAKAIRTPFGVPHICYCHTPARYLWSQTNQYTRGGAKGKLRAAGLALFRNRLRAWDATTSQHVTGFIANSTHTRDLIRDAYDRDAVVIHPPARTDFFTPDPATPRDGSLLVVSALEPYKRVDLAIEIASAASRPLTIIGTGSHDRALRDLAEHQTGAKITFLGHTDDETVRDHYRRASAFLMPQTEDFGITAIEAQACGTPVIARAAGGALDSVIPGQTGLLIDSECSEHWASAINGTPLDLADSCRTNAERFAPERFRKAIRAIAAETSPAQPDQ
ncbi:MAG: glycosyltransferase [Phycisphaerales bacterium]